MATSSNAMAYATVIAALSRIIPACSANRTLPVDDLPSFFRVIYSAIIPNGTPQRSRV
jgi:hypothetical protein